MSFAAREPAQHKRASREHEDEPAAHADPDWCLRPLAGQDAGDGQHHHRTHRDREQADDQQFLRCRGT
jgi:hypothetical protein